MILRWKMSVFSAAVLLCMQTYGFSQASRQSTLSRHVHPKLQSVFENVSDEFSLVETSLARTVKKENLVTNRSRTYDAFIVSVTRIFILERKTRRVFEIRGLPLEWRPFSDLIWQNSHTLVFDRWSEPHYGVHYAVDVKSKKLVQAAAFPDEFYLQQQRPK
jgi:hypothetical protein